MVVLLSFETFLYPVCALALFATAKLAFSSFQRSQICDDPESPLILDESYTSSETAALHYGVAYDGGIVLGDDFRAALLSMPDNGKSSFNYPSDYSISRSTHPQAQAQAATYAVSPYALQNPFATLENPQEQHGHSLPDIAGPPYHAPTSYDHQEHGLAGPSAYSTPLLVVDRFGPSEGFQGTKIHVYLHSPYDIMSAPGTTVYLCFGSRGCIGDITTTGVQSQSFQYRLTAEVPPFSYTGWTASEGPVILRMEDESGFVLQTIELGDFTYFDPSQNIPPASSVHGTGRKRKSSVELDSPRISTKRASSRHLRTDSGDDVPAFSYTPATGSPYSPCVQPAPSTDLYALPGAYGRPRALSSSYQHRPAQRSLSFQHSSSPSLMQHTLTAQSPQTPSWSGGLSNLVSHASRSAGVLAESAPPTLQTGQNVGATSSIPNPPLIRTSTLQQSPSSGTAPNPSQVGQTFNPYAMYPSRAILKIQGDLDGMADNWTPVERRIRRRIVQFRRRQTGSTIEATFEPIEQDERPSNKICISCILWEEKDECYVTSVDTIYLLESLVAVRFTVEEKNRIRRNLEGFRPLTVSKGKADSEEFFKVIMGFGNPKPRNIEKDVKVFPWKILAHALKKIIGKYSASYSSTAGALLTPLSAAGSGSGATSATEYPEAGPSFHHFPSPRSVSEAVPPSSSTLGMSSIALPPRTQVAEGQRAAEQHPDLHIMTSPWLPPQRQRVLHNDAHSSQYQSNELINTNTWGLSVYLETSPVPAAATTTTTNTSNTTTTSMDPRAIVYSHGIGLPPDHDHHIVAPVSGASQSGHPMTRA
ncbi:MAG: hypothetical protein M1837_007549 [Sclerophora amabilis]|nr:MAG: hypothetical protein M1837_007549 [Sclerophora amabilis]